MIVGKGLLASAFEPHFGRDPDVVVFASGVSNSLETNADEFAREEALLRQLLVVQAKRFVYFGSCGVTAAEAELTAYMRHKRAMESLVISMQHGLVLRLPQVVSRTNNPHTLTNFLRDRIVSGEHFTVWAKAERNLIDIDDVVAVGVKLVREPLLATNVVPVAAIRSSPMRRIVEIFEQVLGKSANCSYVDKGTPMSIDTKLMESLSASLSIDLGESYAPRIINKYYAADRSSDACDNIFVAEKNRTISS